MRTCPTTAHLPRTGHTPGKRRAARALLGDLACYGLLAAVYLLVGVPQHLDGMNFGDEGFLAHGATRVMQGQLPNRDFFSLQPPLSFYTVGLLFHWFGPSLATMRTFGLSLYVLMPLLLYAITRHFAGRIIAVAAAMPLIGLGIPTFGFVPFAVWHGILFTLASVWAMLRYSVTPRPVWAALSGATAALTLLARHDQGVYLGVATITFASLYARVARDDAGSRKALARTLGSWSAGLVAVLGPLAAYWLEAGALGAMFRQLVVFPVVVYPRTSALPFPDLRDPSAYPTALLFYLPPCIDTLVLAWLGVNLCRGRLAPAQARVALIAVLASLFYLQVVTRSDIWHAVITLPPFLILGGWLLQSSVAAVDAALERWAPGGAARLRRDAGAGFALMVGAAVAGVFLTSAGQLSSPARPSLELLAIDRAGVRVAPGIGAFVREVARSVQDHAPPGSSILVLPYQPLVYFLLGCRNPTRWDYLWPGDQTIAEHRQLVADAMRDPPGLILLFGRPYVEGFAPTLLEYVDAHYAPIRTLEYATLYAPRQPPPPTRPRHQP